MQRSVKTGVITVMIMVFATSPGCARPTVIRPLAHKSGSSVKYAKGVSSLGFAIQMGAFSDVKMPNASPISCNQRELRHFTIARTTASTPSVSATSPARKRRRP